MGSADVHAIPDIDTTNVPQIVLDLFGLKVKVIQELNSYDDRNYLVQVVPGSPLPPSVPEPWPHGYTLKILNHIDSREEDKIALQTMAILHVLKSDFPTPRPIKTLKGENQTWIQLPGANGDKREKCIVRLFEFLPGKTLEQVIFTPTLCFQVGEYAAKLDIALKTFVPDDEGVLQRMRNKWNMSEIPRLKEILNDSFSDTSKRQLVSDVIDQFTTRVLNRHEQFSHGLIHSDFNEGNILVSTSRPGRIQTMQNGDLSAKPSNNANISVSKTQESVVSVSGVLDFGDTCFTLHIFEVSIAMMYALLFNKCTVTPIEAAGHLLHGYLTHNTLPVAEMDCLRVCVCARLAQSFTLGYYSFALHPENDYTLKHAQRIWPILERLWSLSDQEFLEKLKPYCSFL